MAASRLPHPIFLSVAALALVTTIALGASGTVAEPQQERLTIRVVYPPSGAIIASLDSNFIFGSVSSPAARLTINGEPVTVHESGAFLAWLPVPDRARLTYEIVARLGNDSAQVSHRIGLPPARPVFASSGPLVVDSSSLTPRYQTMLSGDERVRVSVRAPVNATVFALLGDRQIPLVNGAALPDRVFGSDSINRNAGRAFTGDPNRWSTEVPAALLGQGGRLVVRRGSDSVSLVVPPVAAMDSIGPQYLLLTGVPSQLPDTDRVVIARPSPGGTYKWLLLPGTILEMTGREGDFVRARLDARLDVWLPGAEVQLLPRGFAPPRALPANSRLIADSAWVDFIVPTGERVPYAVATFDDRLELTLHGVRANLDNIVYPTADTLVTLVTTIQESSDRARITLRTSEPPFGYLVLWDGRNMVLRLRRAPAITPRAPLRGLTIAVDAGHPPAGATGPTGLYEGVVNLAIAERLNRILTARGAHVVMTRTSDDPVDLASRGVMARRANAHAMVSIHLNALPDGINPFISHGTSTYYFHGMSIPLARDVQSEMLRRLRLNDLGVMYNTFAVTRPTWMPSVLTEGAFIMIPEQEAAARTPAFQTAYATAVADGLQNYFESLARRD